MKKRISKFALMVLVTLVVSLGVAIPAMAEPTDSPEGWPMDTIITKNLHMPDGVVVPEGGLNFTFTFEPAAGSPAIGNQTISFPAGTAPGADGYAMNYIDLDTVLAGLVTTPGLNAGPRDWIVRETVTNQEGVSYDSSTFRMRVHFANIPVADRVDGVALRVAAVEVFTRTADLDIDTDLPTGEYTENKTRNGMVFDNAFVPEVEVHPEFGALSFSKTIADDENWQHADLTTLFDFEATLTAPVLPAPFESPVFASPLTATIMTMDDSVPATATAITDRPATVTFTMSADNTVASASFQLRDGEWLQFSTLPAGAVFEVREIGIDNFSPSANVYEGGDLTAGSVYTPDVESGTSTVGLDLSVNGTVQSEGANRAEFINAYFWSPATGLVLNNIPLFAFALVAAALILMLSSRNRRRIEQTPMAAA